MTKTWILVQGRSSAGIMIAATLSLSVAANKTYASVQDTPISLTSSSWNADVVYAPLSSTDTAVAFDGQYAWDAGGAYLSGPVYLDANLGLPTYLNPLSSHVDPSQPTPFISVATNSVTGSNTEFAFQPWLDHNVNLFSSSSPGGTLTLATATAYDNIAILAASAGSGAGYVPIKMTLTFADGSTSSLLQYNVYDWSKYAGAAGNNALPYPVDRSTAGSTPTLSTSSSLDAGSQSDFQMYETDFNLQSLGYSNKAITSVSFSAPAAGHVGIFALSGYANPTQPLPVQPAAPAPAPAVPLPGSMPLSLTGGTLLALAALSRRFTRNRRQRIQ